MKKLAISERVRLALYLLAVLCGAHLLLLAVLVVTRAIPAFPFGCYALAGAVLYMTVLEIIRRYINRPFQETEKIYRRFANGKAYEEMFECEPMLMPQWHDVLKKFRHLLNKQDAVEMSKKQAEYLALQNQINPHFLYNTLEAIRGDAICAGMDSVAETTEALSIFFRYSITGVDRLVTLEEEIDNVENYFKIQYYRFGEKLKYCFDYSADEDVFQMEVPKLTIQPFVENAIFHGLEKKIGGGTIKVKIQTTLKKLMITISDNGVGMREETVENINRYLAQVAVGQVGENPRKRGGIAMKNVNSRIKLLFGEDYGVQVYSTVNVGTDVIVILPKLRRGSI